MSNSIVTDGIQHLQLKGFWLNLNEAAERNESILEQLSRLGITSLYSRIEAPYGESEKAKELGLKEGDWGAWLGWLKMLGAACESEADIIHLIEDDIKITGDFLKLINWSELMNLLNSGSIICTDGYCSPSQAIAIYEHTKKKNSKQPDWQIIKEGFHIPCINSILLTPSTALSLHNHLSNKLEATGSIPKIDIAIKDFSQGWLTLSPFCTGLSLKMSKQSTVGFHEEDNLANSRMALSLLRCCLMSQVDQEEIADELGGLINSLPKDKFTYFVVKMVGELSKLDHIKPY